MNYFTHVESNRFKVKDPAKFKEEFDLRVEGDEVKLVAFEDGFQFSATNPYISNPACDEDPDGPSEPYMDDMDIPDIVRPHLADGQVLHALYIMVNGRGTELESNLCVATNVAIKWKYCSETFGEMEADLYPRYMTCNTSCHNSEADRWIEEGKKYLATAEKQIRGRWYYEINIKGHTMTWGKEYFNGRKKT